MMILRRVAATSRFIDQNVGKGCASQRVIRMGERWFMGFDLRYLRILVVKITER
ncbi:hypothetical protein ACFV4K_18480 [Nocardia sp. NPDC059764]|uniref:hypothetical protein n=1 Tax=Nocardia sp. NPDC059764 TaxID=3346939 RepID=UPI00364E37D4